MHVEKIDHVAINVRDLAKAEKFFADLLGAEFSSSAIFQELDLRSSINPLSPTASASTRPSGKLRTQPRSFKSRAQAIV